MTRPNGSVTKRPHYVPATYLRAWADQADKVAIRRRGKQDPYTPNITNVAVEGGLYGQGEAALARERLFGRLEEAWPTLRDKLITSGEVRGEDRDAIALFMALQFVRTSASMARRDFISSVAEFTDERPISRDSVRRFLTEKHLGFVPDEPELEGAWSLVAYVMGQGGPPTRDETLNMALDMAVREYAPRFSGMAWTVETCRKAILFTSDRPVMCWRPRTPRDRFEGIGIDTADEIRLPLSPQGLLVLRRQVEGQGLVRVEPKRFAEVNLDIAAQCFEFVATRPNRKADLESLNMARRLPTLRFNTAPGWETTPGGPALPMGDVLHQWVPVREV